MSAFALALIQNRKFLIRITQPCLINHLLTPNQIKWNEEIKNEINMSRYSLYAIDNFKIQSDMKTIDLKNFLSQYDIISIKNNQDWLKSISENKIATSQIKQLGYDPAKFQLHNLFNDWYGSLFKLNQNLEEKYKKFLKKAKPTQHSPLICVQIRIGGEKRKNHASDWKFNDRNITLKVWKFLREKIILKLNNYKLFITTDDEDVQQEAFREFGSENVVTNDGEILHIDRDVQSLNDCSRIEKTILDFHSLQNCDFGIVSSGFGKMGLMNRPNPIENIYSIENNQIKPIWPNVSETYFRL